MKLGYDLTIEQTQKLAMTPELIQAIQILQYNTQELEDFVQDELLQNPLLEYDTSDNAERKDTEVSKTEIISKMEADEREKDLREKVKEAEYDDISYRQWEYSKDHDTVSFEQFVSKEETLEDYLLLQLSFSKLNGVDKEIGKYLIEAMDQNGYITIEMSSVAKEFKVEEERVEKVLDVIQTFEPSGVGARSLAECLIIQLAAKGLLEDTVEYIILHHLEDLADNKLSKVGKMTGLTNVQVQMIADLIRSLEPKPGRNFSSGEDIKYITPDVIVEKVHDRYVVVTNDASLPRLMVSQYYTTLTQEQKDDPNVSKYLNDKFNSALWLIKSIEQRKQTIFNVAQSVINYQKDFMDNGSKYMKTLTLRQIAEELGIHESTVSRTINGKYIQTPRGVFELKYFFSSGVSGIDGEMMSSKSIKSFIKEIIENEDTKKPYSDQDMVEILNEKGIDISRRTVAKYREGMNILSSSKRRRY